MSSSDSGHAQASDSVEPVLHDELLQAIRSVETSGVFATHGVLDKSANPGLCIQGLGSFTLPLDSDDATSIISQSKKAPFGRGNETVIDDNVRKTWEIDASNITFENKKWNIFLQSLVNRVKEELGVPVNSEDIHAELYKLLLYEQGSMFKAHSDTERVSGMFATLTVCLPSEHSGGTINLKHNRTELSFDTDDSSAFDMSFTAWYCDVIHEIAPIKSGYRAILVYNLISRTTTAGVSPSASLIQDQVCKILRPLKLWREYPDAPGFICHALDHRYSRDGLQLCNLKGKDWYRVHCIDAACKEDNNFYVFIGHLVKHDEYGSHEEIKYQVPKTTFNLERIVDLHGVPISLYTVSVNSNCLIQAGLYEDRNRDYQFGGEHTGNESADLEYCYENTVMILVRKERVTHSVLGSSYTHKDLRSYLNQLQKYTKLYGDNSYYRDLINEAFEVFLDVKCDPNSDDFLFKFPDNQYLACIAEAAYALGEQTTFEQVVNSLQTSFNTDNFLYLGEVVDFENPSIPMHCLVNVFSRIQEVHESWSGLKSFRSGFLTSNTRRNDVKQQADLDAFIRTRACEMLRRIEEVRLADGAAVVELSSTFGGHVHEECKKFVTRVDLYTPKSGITLGTVLAIESLSFLQTCGSMDSRILELLSTGLEAAYSSFNLADYSSKSRDYKDEKVFVHSSWPGVSSDATGRLDANNVVHLYGYIKDSDPDKASNLLLKIQDSVKNIHVEDYNCFALPLLEQFLEVLDIKSSSVRSFYQAILATYIMQYVQLEPAKPTDWSRPREVGKSMFCPDPQMCTDCTLFNEFLLDKSRQYFRSEKNHQFGWWPSHYCETNYERMEDGRLIFISTKTENAWKEAHSEWKSRAEIAEQRLQSFPQEQLKELLEDRYDVIVNLKEVKLADETIADANAPYADS